MQSNPHPLHSQLGPLSGVTTALGIFFSTISNHWWLGEIKPGTFCTVGGNHSFKQCNPLYLHSFLFSNPFKIPHIIPTKSALILHCIENCTFVKHTQGKYTQQTEIPQVSTAKRANLKITAAQMLLKALIHWNAIWWRSKVSNSCWECESSKSQGVMPHHMLTRSLFNYRKLNNSHNKICDSMNLKSLVQPLHQGFDFNSASSIHPLLLTSVQLLCRV